MQCCSSHNSPERFETKWDCAQPKARVLLVHGLGEHCGRWAHVAEFFNERGYSVYAYDLRGHGRSGGPRLDIHSFDEYLDDLELMVNKVRAAGLPLIIYGHSMGGLIATRYAASERPQPDAYVLSAPGLAAEVPKWLRLAAKVFGSVLPCLRMDSSIRAEQLSRDPQVGRDYFNDPLVNLKGSARHGKLLLAAMDETREALEHLSLPTLVIHGAADPLVPASASECLEGCTGVERRVFEGLRHEPHNEPEKEQVLGEIIQWLDLKLGY